MNMYLHTFLVPPEHTQFNVNPAARIATCTCVERSPRPKTAAAAFSPECMWLHDEVLLLPPNDLQPTSEADPELRAVVLVRWLLLLPMQDLAPMCMWAAMSQLLRVLMLMEQFGLAASPGRVVL